MLYRRIERLRKKELKKVITGDIGAAYLLVLIPDPEVEVAVLGTTSTTTTIIEGFEAGDLINWQQ